MSEFPVRPTVVPLICTPFSRRCPAPGVVSENLYCAIDPSGSLALISDVKPNVWLML